MCIVREQEEYMSTFPDDQQGEGLIWGSTVEIEIGSHNSRRNSGGSYEDTLTDIDTDSVSGSSSERKLVRKPTHREQTSSPQSLGAEADDEGSLRVRSSSKKEELNLSIDVRGRPRSNTKQLRRRGIDLSRDELRISSRWSSREKRSMENFRDAIKAKANGVDEDENIWIRSAEKRRPILQEARSIKDKFVKSLQRSVSRGRNRKSRKRSQEKAGDPTVQFEHSHQQCTDHLSPTRLQQQDSIMKYDENGVAESKQAYANQCTSWQQHLEYDLQSPAISDRRLRHKKGHYLLRQSSKGYQGDGPNWYRSQGRSVLPSNFFPDYQLRKSSSAGPVLQGSTELYQDIREYHRLPSLSISGELGSASSSGVWPVHKEVLGDIISSGEVHFTERSSEDTTLIASSSASSSVADGHLSTVELVRAARRDLQEQFSGQNSGTHIPLLATETSRMYRHPDSGHSRDWSARPGRLVSSISVPESLNSRLSSCGYRTRTADQTRMLALHSLTTRLPHENLVRPSTGSDAKQHNSE